ncbi:MAG: helix-turn-helix transcriptional regulator [Ruminococcus sp.]|nr:helix-turn-helix transcriptional regulator [Ruminococcus sp.]MBR6923232.1 helix-turn-helix transcriptional regulator [Oscillospiraceae bacterium]
MKTVEIINGLLKQRGISAAKMMSELGFSSGLYSQWKSGKQKPSREKLDKIADYFGVSIDYLLGKDATISQISKNEEKEQKNNATDNSDIPSDSLALNISDSELTDILNRLSDKSLSELESYLDYLLWKQDQES